MAVQINNIFLRKAIAFGLTPFLINTHGINASSKTAETPASIQQDKEVLFQVDLKRYDIVGDIPEFYRTQLLKNGVNSNTLLASIDKIAIDVDCTSNLYWLGHCSSLKTLKLNFLEEVSPDTLSLDKNLERLSSLTISCITTEKEKDEQVWQLKQNEYSKNTFSTIYQSSYDSEEKLYYNQVVNKTDISFIKCFIDRCPHLKSLSLNGFIYTNTTDLSWIAKNQDLTYLSLSPCFYDYWDLNTQVSEALRELKNLSKLHINLRTKLLSDEDKRFIDDTLSSLEIDEIVFRSISNRSFSYEKIKDTRRLCVGEGDNIDFYALKNIDVLDFSHSGLYYAGIYLTEELVDYLISQGIQIELGNNHTLKELRNICWYLDETASALNTNGLNDEEKLIRILNYIFDKYQYADLKSTEDKEYIKNTFYKDGIMYGAIVSDDIICGNYASILCALLNRVGIEAYYIKNSYHAWTLVEIDGTYAYIDATLLDSIYTSYIKKGYSTKEIFEKLCEYPLYLMDPLTVENGEISNSMKKYYEKNTHPYWLSCYSELSKQPSSNTFRLESKTEQS